MNCLLAPPLEVDRPGGGDGGEPPGEGIPPDGGVPPVATGLVVVVSVTVVKVVVDGLVPVVVVVSVTVVVEGSETESCWSFRTPS